MVFLTPFGQPTDNGSYPSCAAVTSAAPANHREPGQLAEPQRSTCTRRKAPNQPAHHLLLHDTSPHHKNTSKTTTNTATPEELSPRRPRAADSNTLRSPTPPQPDTPQKPQNHTLAAYQTSRQASTMHATQKADWLHAAAPTNVTLLNTTTNTLESGR